MVMCVLKMLVAKAWILSATAGARIVHCFSGICWERAYAPRRELGDVPLCRAEEAAEVEARADFDRRHPGIPHPVDGIWWSLSRHQGLPPVRGSPPVVPRGEGDCIGDGRRHPPWTCVDEN